MFEKLLKYSKPKEIDIVKYKSTIVIRQNETYAQRVLYILLLGVFTELFLIGVFDIPNIVNNGWIMESGLYYLITHTLLFLIASIGALTSYKFLRHKKCFILKFIKYENISLIISLSFLSGVAVISGLDQSHTDSIGIYLFTALLIGFVYIMKPRYTFVVFSVSLVLFIIGNILFQNDSAILMSNLTNSIILVIGSFIISITSYNNFIDRTIIEIKLADSTEKLELLTITDDLTRIYNRRMFELNFNDEISRSKRNSVPFSLIMFDIDHFKEVNDQFGHIVGDQILYRLADYIGCQLRLEDTFARYGGDEFLIILSNSILEQATKKAEALQQSIKEVVFEQGIIIFLSFWVTQFIIGEDSEDMLKRVDEALYEAKETGKDKVVSR